MGGSLSLADLAAYSLQLACLIALGVCLPPLFRITAARVRYGYSRALLIVCLLLPWLQGRPTVSVNAVDAGPVFATVDAALPAATAIGPAAAGFPWSAAVAAVFLVGVAIRAAWLSLGLHRLRRLRQIAAESPRYEDVHELQRLLGTRADIRCVTGIGQPVTFGLFRPLIVLPETLRDRSEHVQRAVVAHELIHVQQRDWTWLIAEEAIRTLLWFHPAVWWLISRVQLAREEAVDALAVVVTGTRRGYVEALLAFAGEPELVPVAAFTRRRHLLRRVRLISQESEMSIRRVFVSCLASAAVVAATGWSAVNAFPFTPDVDRLQVPLSGAGSLEEEQRPVTPENAAPLPRSTPEWRIAAGASALRPAPAASVPEPVWRNASDLASGAALQTQSPGQVVPVAPPTPSPPQSEVLRGTATADPPDWPADAVQVGGSVRPPKKVTNVAPVYPPIALAAQVQGVVIVRLLIERDGHVAGARTLRSIPLLDQAALDAVIQWEFEPTLLNGQPMPVTYNVTVAFTLAAPPPPPLPPPPAAQTSTPDDWPADAVRVGGAVPAPRKLTNVAPVYPQNAKAAQVEGVVIVRVLIERDGRVGDTQILRSIPLLDQAATDAVSQWTFEPTLLNGQPVPLIYNVTVTFTLRQ